MDPLSQAVLGASLPQALTRDRRLQPLAFLIGLLSGMAADLDVLIRSSNDPLLFLEYHRQFTHALVFIPLGGFICAVLLYPLVRRKLEFSRIYLFSTLGYATHGLLDGCTSYGTQLLWPFTDTRFSWNNISIVDPLFTLPMLILVITAGLRKNPVYARIAVIFAISYLGFGVLQRERAETIAMEMAQLRGHIPERLTVKPSFGNLVLWKVIYEYQGRYFIDAVKLGMTNRSIEGTSVAKLAITRDLSFVQKGSVQSRDIERFRWFSDDYLALMPGKKNIIVDVRYSLVPNRLNPLWGIQLAADAPHRHADFVNLRDLNTQHRRDFLEMLF